MNDRNGDGKTEAALGKVKEGVGRALGDRDMEREGQAEQITGKVRDAAENVKDAVRDAEREQS